MNKFFSLFFVVIIFSFFVFLLSTSHESRYSMFDFAPDNASAIFIWKNFSKYNEYVKNNSMVALFKQEEFNNFFDKTIFSMELFILYDKISQNYNLLYKYISTFISSKSNFTLIFVNNHRGVAENNHNNFCYIAIIDVDNGRLRKDIGDQLSASQFKVCDSYQNFEIYVYCFDDLNKFYFVFLDNRMIVGGDVEIIKGCVDKFLQKKIGFRSGFKIKTIRDRFNSYLNADCDFMCMFDMKYNKKYIQNTPLFSFVDSLFSVQFIGIKHLFLANSGSVEIEIFTNEGQDSQLLGNDRLYFQPFFHDSNFTQRDILFFWTNQFYLTRVWSWIEGKDGYDLLGLREISEKYFNINGRYRNDGALKSLGKEFGLLIDGQSIPHLSGDLTGCLVFEVVDRDMVQNILRKLLAGMQTVTINSADLNIISVNIAGGLLRPSYCFKDKYLFVADNADIIERCWYDFFSSSKNLHAIVDSNKKFTDKFYVFSRIGDLSSRLYPLLNFFVKEGGEWMNMLSLQNRALVRGVGLPLLAALRSVSSSSLRVSTAPNMLYLQLDYTLKKN